MLYPPRLVVPVLTMSARYLSEDERVSSQTSAGARGPAVHRQGARKVGFHY